MADEQTPVWLRLLRNPQRARVEMGGDFGIGGGRAMPLGPSGGFAPLLPGQAPLPQNPQAQMLADLIAAIWKQTEVFTQTFSAQVIPERIRPAENRKYLFIQNQSGADNIILGLNQPPGAIGGTPANGLIIPFNFGFYEPIAIPQGEIWIAAGVANVPGVILYSA